MANAPDDYRDDLERALKLIEKKRAGYITARDMYDGTRAEVSASPTVQRLIEQNAEAYPLSLAHIPVDVLADKVDALGLTAKDAAADTILQRVADANDLDDEADDWVRKACMFGDYYVIVDPEREVAGSIDIDSVKWVGSSPLTTIVMYDDKDGRTPEYSLKRWSVGTGEKQHWRALLGYDDVTIKLITGQGVATPSAEDFTPDYPLGGKDGDERIEHEGGRLLVKHLAIDGKPYGKPVHFKAFGPQDAITKINAVNLSNVDGQGFASRWALQDPLAEVDDDIDADFGDDGPDTPANDRDGLTKLTRETGRVRSLPGAIALLKGIKQVGQFDATDSEDFLKNLDWYVRVMALACGIPIWEFDMKGEQPSGESRRRAEGRVNKHAKKIVRATSSFLVDLADTTLGLVGRRAEVTANFAPLETSTDKDGLELVGMKVENGVPIRVALLEAGYSSEQVDEWWPSDTPGVTIGMLQILGTALAALGNAKTLGVISDTELADMLPTILTGARNEGGGVTDPAPATEQVTDNMVTNPGEVVKAKADAVGALIRAGADPEQAADMVGLTGLEFPNVPVTVRLPETQATQLEQK